MADVEFIGGAIAVAQVTDYLFAGTWETSDVITLTIGQKTVSTTAGSTTEATIVDSLVALWNALDGSLYPEFDEITASRTGDTLRLTADTEGVPFECTVATTETGGGAADDQTIDGGASSTGTNSTPCSGPKFASVAANYSGGALPSAGNDLWLTRPGLDILYGLDAFSAFTLTSFNKAATFTGQIGLPDHTGLYPEYRDKALIVEATTVNLEYGPGEGSSFCRIDSSNVQTTVNSNGGASPLDGYEESILWKGTHASNVVNVNRGKFGIARGVGDVAVVATLRIGYINDRANDATVRCGVGTTLTDIDQSGGILETSSNITTVDRTAGEHTVHAGTVGTLNDDGGTTFYNTTGTLTLANIGDQAVLDFRQNMAPRTVSACNVYGRGEVHDPFKVITFSAGIDCERTAVIDDEGQVQAKLNLGTNLKVTRAAVA